MLPASREATVAPSADAQAASAARLRGREQPGTRVCALVQQFHPVVGGTETHTRLLAERLIETGTDVLVITRRSFAELPRKESVGAISVRRVAPTGFRRFGKYFMGVPALAALVRERRNYDVILVCGFKVLGIVGVAAGKLLRKPCVLRSEVSGELSGDYAVMGSQLLRRSRLAAALFRAYIVARNRILKRSDLFLSFSRAVTAELLACGISPGSIRYIPNGVDTDLFRPIESAEKRSLRARLALPENAQIITYSGRLVEGKGLLTLMEAFRRLTPSHPKAFLLLVGSGKGKAFGCEEELREYVVRHGLQNRVRMTGYVSNVHEYLRASDVFVLPSESEGLPLALVEALACGLPSVATPVGGIVDMVTDGVTGMLVPLGNAEALASTVSRLLHDAQTAALLGQNGRQAVEHDFSISVVAEEHHDALASVLQSGSRASRDK